MIDNNGYFDPAAATEAFDPFEADDWICWLIVTSQAPGPDRYPW